MKIDCRLDTDDYKKFAGFVNTWARAEPAKSPTHPVKRKILRLIIFLLLGMSIVYTQNILNEQFNFYFHAYTFGAGLIVGMFVQIASMIISSRRMMPWKDGIVLSPERMIIDDTGIETQQANWQTIGRRPGFFAVKETETHFFLMLDNCAGHIVPKRAFADANQLDEFRNLLVAHAVPVA